ncbi:unnamed protein product, partial [Mesorhabditis belari]|uniref:RNA-directed RNA polymerase n=1 Tax=Mesorhabditis belari TaxID=2138241 RepID=A0AAF3J667_9BILA
MEGIAAAYAFLKTPQPKKVSKEAQLFVDDEQFSARMYSMDVVLIIPKPSYSVNPKSLLRCVADTIKKCHAKNITFKRMVPMPKAEYEEKEYEISFSCEFALAGHSDLDDLTRCLATLYKVAHEFCRETAYLLHDQPKLSLPAIMDICTEEYIVHQNIPMKSIMVGSLVNPGLFFVRGDYFTQFNCPSNPTIPFLKDSRQTYVTGHQDYLSFATFEHDRRELKICFGVKIKPQEDGLNFAGFMLKLKYGNIVSINIDCTSDSETCVFLQLKHPPQLYEAIPRQRSKNRRYMNLDQCRDWVRVLSWPGYERSLGCSKETLGNSSHVGLTFSNYVFDAMTEKIYISEPGTDKHPPSTWFWIAARIAARSRAQIYFSAIKQMRRSPPVIRNIPDIGSFRANYALHALVTRGSRVTDQLFECQETSTEDLAETPFFLAVRRAFQECPEACESTLENLLSGIDELRVMDIMSAFDKIYCARFSEVRNAVLEASYRNLHPMDILRDYKEIPKNCVFVRKVMVCPQRTLFMSPEVMLTNRVVRYFGEEYAMRCVFRDDSGYTLHTNEFYIGNSSSFQENPEIFTQMIRNTMMEGLRIVDREYKFLAWSNSQMRDYGCYLYASKIDSRTGKSFFTIDSIRAWMGDFSMCTSVPKMMSRMGQCFTQAQPTIKLRRDEWVVEEDIEGGSGHPETGEDYCFSDGVGRIGMEHAVMIAIALELPYIPSCFQVRFKGFKGVLTIDRELDKYDGPKVIFRKSQEKFHDIQDGDSLLEVVKYSMFSPVCLNRPLINVIDQVAHKQGSVVHQRVSRTIHQYLERELSTLTKMLLDEHEAAIGLNARLPLAIDFARILQCGFSLTDEPFIRRLLLSVYKYNIIQHLSKSKMKIFLPVNLGRTMYGVVDDSGLLQNGQVFIQYSTHRIRDKLLRGTSSMAQLKTKIHKGSVLVSKNPCRVGGDVRIFEAVYQPALAHLVDVIVFPRYGPRPHPDEMAGSDLDGDEYCVIFDQECFFEHNEEAMVFPKTKSAQIKEIPTTEAMVSFFVRYLTQDSIGRLSNAHLTASDYYGLFADVCESIARKCSIGVDFPKSGVPADNLQLDELVDCSPDYMEHRGKPQYLSKWLNGQLYRKVKKIADIIEQVDCSKSPFDDDTDDMLIPEKLDCFANERNHEGQIRQLKKEYSARMQALLDEYGIGDEAQIVSGHILSLKRLTQMERDDYSFFHTDKIVEMRYAAIFDHFRKQFFKEFGQEEDFIQDNGKGKTIVHCMEAMERRAIQWYAVAYDRECGRSFLSFGWIVWDVLASAKRTRAFSALSEHALQPNTFERSKICALLSKKAREMRQMDPDFMPAMEKHELVKRYASAYGDGVLDMFYILHRWIEKKSIEKNCKLGFRQLSRLLVQYCHGSLHGSGHETDSMPSFIFKKKVMFDTKFEKTDERKELEIPGEMFINFIRYIGSSAFANVEFIDLDLDDGSPGTFFIFNPEEWTHLSQIAYKTIHHVAVSGRFNWLGIGSQYDTKRFGEQTPREAREVESERAETQEPIIIRQEVLNGISSDGFVEAIQKWSGCDVIRSRSVQNRLLVSAVGSVVARQRLVRLLLMHPQDLREAIREGCPPRDALDGTLD